MQKQRFICLYIRFKCLKKRLIRLFSILYSAIFFYFENLQRQLTLTLNKLKNYIPTSIINISGLKPVESNAYISIQLHNICIGIGDSDWWVTNSHRNRRCVYLYIVKLTCYQYSLNIGQMCVAVSMLRVYLEKLQETCFVSKQIVKQYLYQSAVLLL